MIIPLNVVSKRSTSGVQEVQGIVVMREKGEFVFNYNTSKDPDAHDLELLKIFRNRFVDELGKLNKQLSRVIGG